MKILKLYDVPDETAAVIHFFAKREGSTVPEIAKRLLEQGAEQALRSSVTAQPA